MQLVPLNLTATHGQQPLSTSSEGERSSEWRVGEGLGLSLADVSQGCTLGNRWRLRESKTYGSTSGCHNKL